MGIYPGHFKMGFELTFKKKQNWDLAYLLVPEGFSSQHRNWALWKDLMEWNPTVVLMQPLHSVPDSCHRFPLRIHWKAVLRLLQGIIFPAFDFGAIRIDYNFLIIESCYLFIHGLWIVVQGKWGSSCL